MVQQAPTSGELSCISSAALAQLRLMVHCSYCGDDARPIRPHISLHIASDAARRVEMVSRVLLHCIALLLR